MQLLRCSRAVGQVYSIRCIGDSWMKLKGHLGDCRITTIEKAIRRSFDSLNVEDCVAVGLIDAWYGDAGWSLGVKILAAGIPDKSTLYDVFPLGVFELENVKKLKPAVETLFEHRTRAALLWPSSEGAHSARGSREYRAWVSLLGRERLFRYGCDRYFNPLQKEKKRRVLKPKKRHPYPHWLTPYQFGNHPEGCECSFCL